MSLLQRLFTRSCRQFNYNKLITSQRMKSQYLLHQHNRRTTRSESSFTPNSGDSIIRAFAAKQPTILNLKELIDYTGTTEARMMEYGKFIWEEIPIRISHRVVELSGLPYNLSNTSAIRELKDLYTHSFHSFRMLESPDNKEKELQFIEQMKKHFNSLKSAVPLIANGLSEAMALNPNQAPLIKECPFLNGFLNRFHGARIGTRLLTGQYISCKEQQNNPNKKSNILGLIDFECNPQQILETAIDDSTRLCESNFGKSPEVNIKSQNKNIKFTYIPSDLHYIFLELMKNSMRAVCENYPNVDDRDDLPEIECVIVASKSSDDLTVKISDQGGGISRDNMDKIWYYSFSTVAPDIQPVMDSYGNITTKDDAKDNKQPMAGFGYGLPLSRLYCRYFGGDLEVISMDGYGSDAFIYLNWLKPDDVKPLSSQNVLDD